MRLDAEQCEIAACEGFRLIRSFGPSKNNKSGFQNVRLAEKGKFAAFASTLGLQYAPSAAEEAAAETDAVAAAAAVAAPPVLPVVKEAEGYKLFLSSDNATGYKGVQRNKDRVPRAME